MKIKENQVEALQIFTPAELNSNRQQQNIYFQKVSKIMKSKEINQANTVKK